MSAIRVRHSRSIRINVRWVSMKATIDRHTDNTDSEYSQQAAPFYLLLC